MIKILSQNTKLQEKGTFSRRKGLKQWLMMSTQPARLNIKQSVCRRLGLVSKTSPQVYAIGTPDKVVYQQFKYDQNFEQVCKSIHCTSIVGMFLY